jgi:hypothetical protein
LPGVPESLRGRYVAHVRIAYTGDTESGEQLVALLRAVGPRLIDTLKEVPYTAAGSIYNDPTEPHAYSADNAMLGELDAAAVRTVLEMAGPDAPVLCIVQLRHLGGTFAHPPAAPSAVGHRDARYLLVVLSPLNRFDLTTVRTVHQRLTRALEPWTIGGGA